MAKKKEEFQLPPGTPAPWMSTFSDMMTLLMCFFVLLFSMSEVDAAKFEEVAKSFQSTISIFRAGSKAVGDGILVSNGVSQLNMLDEYINSSGKTAESDSKSPDPTKDGGAAAEKLQEVAAQLDMTKEEVESLVEALDNLEHEKLNLSQ